MRLPFLSRIRSRFRELVGADSGQVAITFGLALIPMVLAIGCGVDISRAIAARSSLVNALDATALAVARMPLSSSVAQTNTAEMTKVAHAYFYANHAGSDVGTVTSLGIAPATSGQGWLFTATARVPTAFMSLAGFDFVEVDATTEVMREARALEMALVLDTTASMQGPRISALRTAAESLVNSVAVDPSVRLAVVPFAQYVNIGTANRSIPGDDEPQCHHLYRDRTVSDHLHASDQSAPWYLHRRWRTGSLHDL
jgi:Flp pilus assembly protein TadG